MLDDDDLERYSRQILVPGIDLQGQKNLIDAAVVVVGCGGLGCPLSLYLAAAGVGRITLFDPDRVALSNLPRQIAFREADVARLKTEALASRLREMNSRVEVIERPCSFTESEHVGVVEQADLVLDASDSLKTRLAIEAVTLRAKKPWILGAAVQMSGQWMAFSGNRPAGWLRAVYSDPMEDCDQPPSSGSCSRLGISGPTVGMVAMMQAGLAIRFLAGEVIDWGYLTIYDVRTGEQQRLHVGALGAAVC